MSATETHQVTSPLVQARLVDGTHVHVYEGGFLPAGVDPVQLEQLVAAEMVTGGSSNKEADQDDDRPAGNASRDAWAEYAHANGHDVDDEMTRDELRALFD